MPTPIEPYQFTDASKEQDQPGNPAQFGKNNRPQQDAFAARDADYTATQKFARQRRKQAVTRLKDMR